MGNLEQQHRMSPVYQTALAAWGAGISVIPIPPDGSKHPKLPWAVFQQRQATAHELTCWFRDAQNGIALITGAVSAGLEVLDFDTPEIYRAWSQRMREAGWTALHERLSRGYLEASPNGIHLLYRCSDLVEGNQKLASHAVEGTLRCKTLIETRGEGGLVVVAPSGGGVHPSGKPYLLLQGGMSTIQTITAAERQILLKLARTFDEFPPIAERHRQRLASLRLHEDRRMGHRPGDLYNQRVFWQEVLEPHGWTLVRVCGCTGYWCRPGKDFGISATTNYQGWDLLYVFSTSTLFEVGRWYSKFHAYTILEHQGNFAAAASTLAQQGYTEGR